MYIMVMLPSQVFRPLEAVALTNTRLFARTIVYIPTCLSTKLNSWLSQLLYRHSLGPIAAWVELCIIHLQVYAEVNAAPISAQSVPYPRTLVPKAKKRVLLE